MATLHDDDLTTLVGSLGVGRGDHEYPLADTLNRPLDIFRAFLADVLVQLTSCDPQIAYTAIQAPHDYGDLEVVVPKLRLKGSKPRELASRLAAEVCSETPQMC